MAVATMCGSPIGDPPPSSRFRWIDCCSASSDPPPNVKLDAHEVVIKQTANPDLFSSNQVWSVPDD